MLKQVMQIIINMNDMIVVELGVLISSIVVLISSIELV